MLYTKGERRYVEATQSEILLAASDVLENVGLSEDAVRLAAFSKLRKAQEDREARRELELRAARKRNLLPGHKAEEPRSGGEPA